MTDITDGTSNTIAIGESIQCKEGTSVSCDPYWGSGTHTATMGRTPAGDPCFTYKRSLEQHLHCLGSTLRLRMGL